MSIHHIRGVSCSCICIPTISIFLAAARHSEIQINYIIMITSAPYYYSMEMYVPGRSHFILRGLQPRSGSVQLYCAAPFWINSRVITSGLYSSHSSPVDIIASYSPLYKGVLCSPPVSVASHCRTPSAFLCPLCFRIAQGGPGFIGLVILSQWTAPST